MFTQIAFCYICLSNTKHLVNIDRVGNDRVKLLDMLTYLTFETSCIEEDIPMYMCDDCEVNLTAAYNLKVLCQKNNIYVRRYLFYLKQFTHPTSFTSETEVKNSPVNKEKPPENKNKSGTDEIITIQLDLTNISDESDVEITEIQSQNEPKSVQTEVRNNQQPEQYETSNTSILSKRPEFNSKLLQSKNTSAELKSGVNDVKSNNILYNKVALINETLRISRQTHSASKVSSGSGILSNRPEFNVYKNGQTNQLINCQWYNKIKNDLNHKLTSNTEQSATVVNAKVKLKSSNNFPSSTNKNAKLKRKSEENLVKTEKPLKKQCTIEESNKSIVQNSLEFNDFDIVSTVKLRKRKRAPVLPTQINNKFLKKMQKKTFNIKKDRKAIQWMNKCRVLLHRVKVIMKEQSSIENKTNTDEIQSENNLITNHNDINLVDKNDNESIKIKEETNDDENTDQNCTATQNNTILSVNSTTQDEQSINVINFENILIKEEVFDNEDTTVIKDEDKSVQDDPEFSFKIEIVDDTSSNSVKIETTSEDLNSTVHSITSAENIVNNSVFSFSNAEFLNCDESLNTTKDLTESTTREYCTATVGNANVTKSTTREHCTATVGSASVTKFTDKYLEAVELISDNNININTTCDDSTDSDELIIDEDATSNDATFGSIASAKSVTKPVPSKVLSPRCFRRNVYKRYLDFTTNETVSRDGKQTSYVDMLSLATLLKRDDSDSYSDQSIVVEADSDETTFVKALSDQTTAVKAAPERTTAVKALSGQTTAVKALSEQAKAVKALFEPTKAVPERTTVVKAVPEHTTVVKALPEQTKAVSEQTTAVKALSGPTKAVPERTTVVKAVPEHTTFFKALPEQTKAVIADSYQATALNALPEQSKAVQAVSEQSTAFKALPEQTKAVKTGSSYQVTFVKALPEQAKVIKAVFEQTKAVKADSYQGKFVNALSEQIKADSYRATFVKTLSEQSKAVKALSEPTTTFKAIFEPTTLAKAIFEPTTVAKPVSELKRELLTVQLPNYKFPVNKRLLNFTSRDPPVDNVAPTSSHLQPEPDTQAVKLPNMNGKPAPCKTTTGSPALVETKSEKPDTTLHELPKKVGSPATMETSVARTEESTADLRMSPFQLMIQQMCHGRKNISNNTATLTSADENTCTSVGITDKSEETTSVKSESSNQDNLSSATSDDKQHKCPECSKSFPRAFKLKQHMLIHKNFYHCPICIEKFPNKSKFKAHMLIHKEHKYKCFMCDEILPTHDALVQHYKVDHKNTRICHKCKLIFKNRRAHILHKKSHQPKRTCPICSEQFTETAFKEHERSHKLSKCPQCEKYVDTKQLSTHNCRALCEKTYKCTECAMTFYFQPSLDKHMRVHYETRCFICAKTFYKPHAIVEHMSNHFGTKGYQCPKCNFCSFSKEDMKLHIANDCKVLMFQTVKQ